MNVECPSMSGINTKVPSHGYIYCFDLLRIRLFCEGLVSIFSLSLPFFLYFKIVFLCSLFVSVLTKKNNEKQCLSARIQETSVLNSGPAQAWRCLWDKVKWTHGLGDCFLRCPPLCMELAVMWSKLEITARTTFTLYNVDRWEDGCCGFTLTCPHKLMFWKRFPQLVVLFWITLEPLRVEQAWWKYVFKVGFWRLCPSLCYLLLVGYQMNNYHLMFMPPQTMAPALYLHTLREWNPSETMSPNKSSFL